MPTGKGTSKRGRPKGSKNKPKPMKKQGQKDREDEKLAMEIKGVKDKMSSKSSKKKKPAGGKKTAPSKGKVYTAKNGRKYIKMANGRTRFIKG